MLGVYFSGTGNSKYCLEKFLSAYTGEYKLVSIENSEACDMIRQSEEIVIAYPVYFSNLPKILRDYIVNNNQIWDGKKIFIIATMGLFSGDGSGVLARLLKKYGAVITGGLHLKMPDCIADEKVLKRSREANAELIRAAEEKILQAASNVRSGKKQNEGLGFFCQIAGLFGQRLWFNNKTRNYTDKLKISSSCIGCGICEAKCPMSNIRIENKKASAGNRCTMCYRCINLCPRKAVTLLGKNVVQQYRLDNYLK
ncbi:MAG: EFR1 family ferrodoxin [Oscillospiraceae bacterium]|nr:EFR1 family ferrodoxin [Oscillospiraceae bacterium]